MGSGRKKKPDEIKVMQGTFRNDRANPEAPHQDKAGLVAPSWLPEDCLDYFQVICERISVYSLDSASWTEAAAMIAMRLAEINACNRIIADEGRTYRSETVSEGGQAKVMIKGHPAVSQRNEAMRHLQSLLSEFGLTPATISKLSVPGGKEASKDDPWEKMKAK